MARRLALAFGLVVLDLWSKSAVFRHLQGSADLIVDAHGHARWHLLDGWLTFMLSLNPGAAFGGFAQWPWALVAGRVLAVVYLTWLLARTPRGRRVFTLALALILAGALGNLHDNLRFADWGAWGDPSREFSFGAVRDFIDVYFARWDWHFPTFNVADSCITVGAGLLLVTGLLGGRAHEAGREESDHADAAGEPAASERSEPAAAESSEAAAEVPARG